VDLVISHRYQTLLSPKYTIYLIYSISPASSVPADAEAACPPPLEDAALCRCCSDVFAFEDFVAIILANCAGDGLPLLTLVPPPTLPCEADPDPLAAAEATALVIVPLAAAPPGVPTGGIQLEALTGDAERALPLLPPRPLNGLLLVTFPALIGLGP